MFLFNEASCKICIYVFVWSLGYKFGVYTQSVLFFDSRHKLVKL